MYDMFFEAFGLDPNQMEEGEKVYVGEAGVGIKGINPNGEVSLNKILYAVKKKKAPRVKIELESGLSIIVTESHKFGVQGKETVEWWTAKSLMKDKKELFTLEGPSPVVSVTPLKEDNTLDIQVENTENYFSNGILSHNSMYGPTTTTPGGYAVKYYSSWRGRITRLDYIKNKGLITGIVCKVKNKKNKVGVPFRESELKLSFENGFDSTDEYMQFIVDLGIVKQGGAWFSNEEWGMKVQGRDGVLTFLKEQPLLFEQVKKQINEMLCKETVLDEENEDIHEEETDGSLPGDEM